MHNSTMHLEANTWPTAKSKSVLMMMDTVRRSGVGEQRERRGKVRLLQEEGHGSSR